MEGELSQGNLIQRILSMQRELNDLFKKTFGRDPFGVDFDPERWERWMPPADFYARDGQWIIRVELPEVSPSDVSLSIIGNRLLIEGERKPPDGFQEENSIFHECPYGPFERVVTLPGAVPEDQIEASYRQGVLYITLPAIEEMGKNIEIESEEKESGEPPEEEEKAA